MNKKIVLQFLGLTFLIASVSWGISELLKLCGVVNDQTEWLIIFVSFAALSPTIASYIVLKANKQVTGFKDWIKRIFTFKCPVCFYLLVLLLLIVYLAPQIAFADFSNSKPWYMFFALIPLVFFAGGLEEVGWNYPLRPEMDKKFGFILTALIFSAIWIAWHFFVFDINGRVLSLEWFGLFAVSCIGMSFAITAISKITQNVWLCILFHTLQNAISGTVYEYSAPLLGNVISMIATIIVSIIVVTVAEKYNKRKLQQNPQKTV